MSNKNKKRHIDHFVWPTSAGFKSLAEESIEAAADDVGSDMVTDAIVDAIVPEPFSILLEIKGISEQLSTAQTMLKETGLQVKIINQRQLEEDEEEYDI